MADFATRKKIYKQIEKNRGSKVLTIVNGDRQGWETQLSRDFIDIIIDHLDLLPKTETISLILHTNGGDTLTAWRLINLLRQFCVNLEVLIPLKALSAGTLIALGGDKIIMTKQASLGPIDPSVNTPLNPLVPGAPVNARAPVSVEAIKGYLEIAQKDLSIKDDASMASIFTFLSGQIHPIVLGQVFRARSQIQFLARKLLKNQLRDAEKEKVDGLISFLCSESGSHDYSIDRDEGRELGLKIESPSEDLYKLLRNIHISFRDELMVNTPFDPKSILGGNQSAGYEVRRCLIESVSGGCNAFISKGILKKQTQQMPLSPGMPQLPPQDQIIDQRDFEGWRKI